MQLKGALLWSLFVHAGLLIARPPAGIVSSPKFFHAPELTFLPTFTAPVIDAPPVQAPPANAPSLRGVPPRLLRPSGARNDSGLGTRNDTPQTVKPPPPTVQELRGPAAPQVVAKGVELETAGTPAAALAEKEFAQLTYRKQLREHLKRHLLYPAGSTEGTIHLRLELLPTGALKKAFIVEASDAQLAAACLEGVQSAAPFPSLPKEISPPEAHYEFLVQYRSN